MELRLKVGGTRREYSAQGDDASRIFEWCRGAEGGEVGRVRWREGRGEVSIWDEGRVGGGGEEGCFAGSEEFFVRRADCCKVRSELVDARWDGERVSGWRWRGYGYCA